MFYPSDIARLVLGYLHEEKCLKSWQTFLEESSNLKEYFDCYKKGRICPTNICGRSLLDILNEYSSLKIQIENNDVTNSVLPGNTNYVSESEVLKVLRKDVFEETAKHTIDDVFQKYISSSMCNRGSNSTNLSVDVKTSVSSGDNWGNKKNLQSCSADVNKDLSNRDDKNYDKQNRGSSVINDTVDINSDAMCKQSSLQSNTSFQSIRSCDISRKLNKRGSLTNNPSVCDEYNSHAECKRNLSVVEAGQIVQIDDDDDDIEILEEINDNSIKPNVKSYELRSKRSNASKDQKVVCDLNKDSPNKIKQNASDSSSVTNVLTSNLKDVEAGSIVCSIQNQVSQVNNSANSVNSLNNPTCYTVSSNTFLNQAASVSEIPLTLPPGYILPRYTSNSSFTSSAPLYLVINSPAPVGSNISRPLLTLPSIQTPTPLFSVGDTTCISTPVATPVNNVSSHLLNTTVNTISLAAPNAASVNIQRNFLTTSNISSSLKSESTSFKGISRSTESKPSIVSNKTIAKKPRNLRRTSKVSYTESSDDETLSEQPDNLKGTKRRKTPQKSPVSKKSSKGVHAVEISRVNMENISIVKDSTTSVQTPLDVEKRTKSKNVKKKSLPENNVETDISSVEKHRDISVECSANSFTPSTNSNRMHKKDIDQNSPVNSETPQEKSNHAALGNKRVLKVMLSDMFEDCNEGLDMLRNQCIETAYDVLECNETFQTDYLKKVVQNRRSPRLKPKENINISLTLKSNDCLNSTQKSEVTSSADTSPVAKRTTDTNSSSSVINRRKDTANKTESYKAFLSPNKISEAHNLTEAKEKSLEHLTIKEGNSIVRNVSPNLFDDVDCIDIKCTVQDINDMTVNCPEENCSTLSSVKEHPNVNELSIKKSSKNIVVKPKTYEKSVIKNVNPNLIENINLKNSIQDISDHNTINLTAENHNTLSSVENHSEAKKITSENPSTKDLLANPRRKFTLRSSSPNLFDDDDDDCIELKELGHDINIDNITHLLDDEESHSTVTNPIKCSESEKILVEKVSSGSIVNKSQSKSKKDYEVSNISANLSDDNGCIELKNIVQDNNDAKTIYLSPESHSTLTSAKKHSETKQLTVEHLSKSTSMKPKGNSSFRTFDDDCSVLKNTIKSNYGDKTVNLPAKSNITVAKFTDEENYLRVTLPDEIQNNLKCVNPCDISTSSNFNFDKSEDLFQKRVKQSNDLKKKIPVKLSRRNSLNVVDARDVVVISDNFIKKKINFTTNSITAVHCVSKKSNIKTSIFKNFKLGEKSLDINKCFIINNSVSDDQTNNAEENKESRPSSD